MHDTFLVQISQSFRDAAGDFDGRRNRERTMLSDHAGQVRSPDELEG